MERVIIVIIFYYFNEYRKIEGKVGKMYGETNRKEICKKIERKGEEI